MSIRPPYYIFDREKFSSLIGEYLKFGDLYFPVKANDDDLIINAVQENDCGFEVDSIEHIEKLIKCGISSDKLLYSYPIREEIDIKEAIEKGVHLFVVDSIDEYRKIARLTNEARYIVRVNVLSIVKNELSVEHNKWGLSINDSKELISIIRTEGQALAGISFYVTSEINHSDTFETVLNCLMLNFRNLDVEFVNIGGGISIDKLESMTVLIEQVRSTIKAKRILLEPGRHLLNPCIDMIVSVMAIRTIDTRRLIFINAGIYLGLMDTIIKNRKYIIVDDKQIDSSMLVQSYVCGSSSDISDTLGEYQLRSNLMIGDTLTIKECGAYSMVMQTHFYGKEHMKMILKGI